MCKKEFLSRLQKGLQSLPPEERDERLSFYSDMIDDRMEEGYSEEEAVSAAGSVESLLCQILSEQPPESRQKERKSVSAWEIILLILGAPLWLSLLIAAFAILFSVVASLWSVVLALWASFAAVALCSFGFFIGGIAMLVSGYGLSGFVSEFACLICSGVAILLFLGCRPVTRGMVWLTKKLFLGLGKCFIRTEVAK